MQVTIYSTTTCPYCKMLKNYLTEKNIAYVEKLVDQDDNAKSELASISGGFLGVPFTFIVKDDGQQEKVVGFDKEKINSILEIV